RGTCTVTLEVPVLEIDARLAVGLRREADLDLAGLRHVGLEAPLVRDLPRPHEPMRRLPHRDVSPRTIRPVFLFAVAAPADERLDDRFLHRRLADVMRTRPPRIETVGEDAERALDGRVDGDALPDGCHGAVCGHGAHRSSLWRSAASLK